VEHAFSHFVEKLAWFEEKKKRKCGTGLSLYKMEFSAFQGFQVRPRFSEITPLQNGLLYF